MNKFSSISMEKGRSVISWNINGVRSVVQKGFLEWLRHTYPDILCLQETRISHDLLPLDLADPIGYNAYWNCATRPGYSGTALLSRERPLNVSFATGNAEYDKEGRFIIAEYPDFSLINCYFPNGNRSPDRLSFKLGFLEHFLRICATLMSEGRNLIICGDVNIAHADIDLASPRDNKYKSGFLAEERAWIDRLLSLGLADTFRHFFPEKQRCYSWFPATPTGRSDNGWRYDYVFASRTLVSEITEAYISESLRLSDHCPVGIALRVRATEDCDVGHIGFSQRQLSLF